MMRRPAVRRNIDGGDRRSRSVVSKSSTALDRTSWTMTSPPGGMPKLSCLSLGVTTALVVCELRIVTSVSCCANDPHFLGRLDQQVVARDDLVAVLLDVADGCARHAELAR